MSYVSRMPLQPLHNLRAFWGHLTGARKWFVGTSFGFVVLYLAGLFWGDWLLRTGLPFLWDAVVTYARSPLGLWLPLSVIAVAVLWAAINPPALLAERRKVVAAVAVPIPPDLSPKEANEVQQIRQLWNLYLQPAAQRMASMLNVAIYMMEQRSNKLYWYSLVKPVQSDFQQAMMRMGDAVDDSSMLGLSAVQSALNEAHRNYRNAWLWVARISENEDINVGPDLAKWRQFHAEFAKEFRHLEQRPEQKKTGVLQDFGFFDSAPLRFLDGTPKPSSPASDPNSEGHSQ